MRLNEIIGIGLPNGYYYRNHTFLKVSLAMFHHRRVLAKLILLYENSFL